MQKNMQHLLDHLSSLINGDKYQNMINEMRHELMTKIQAVQCLNVMKRDLCPDMYGSEEIKSVANELIERYNDEIRKGNS